MKSNTISTWVGILLIVNLPIDAVASAHGGGEETALMPAILAGIFSILVALIGSLTSYNLAIKKSEGDLEKLQREYRLEFAAERVVRNLLNDKEWYLRSFRVIRHHLGGFDDDGDDLQKVLLRAGAIRFKSKSGQELWGLLERNRHRLGQINIDDDPGERLLNPSSPSQT